MAGARKPRQGKQIGVRVPDYVKADLDALPGKLAAHLSGKEPSDPEIVAALISALKPVTVARAIRAYRKELERRGIGNFHR